MHGHSLSSHDDDRPDLVSVSITISVVAVLLAVVSLLGHRAHARTILAQNRMGDAWVHYQSKALSRVSYDALLDFLSSAQLSDPANAERVKAEYQQKIDQATGEQKAMETKALAFEAEAEHRETAADRFDLADVLLEAAVVIISITLLTKRWLYWGIGVALACVGLLIAATGLFVG